MVCLNITGVYVRSELSLHNQLLLLQGNGLVISTELQCDILCYIHYGYQGIVTCLLHASESVARDITTDQYDDTELQGMLSEFPALQ